MQFSKVAAAAAVALTMSYGAVSAAPITGSISIDVGLVTGGGGPLVPGLTLTMNQVSYGTPGDGDFLALVGQAINNFNVTLTTGTALAFTGVGGSFSGVVSNVFFLPAGGGFANVVAVDGTFTPDPLFIPFATLTENPETLVRLSLTFLGVGYGAGGALEAAAPTIPDTVPEPLSLGLFGLGLAGLGVAMRRRTTTA